MLIETTRTATHEYEIYAGRYGPGTFTAQFRPLNPKTGEPWQAPHRVTRGADFEPEGWAGRPIAYSTLASAQAAVAWKKTTLKGGRT